jgi:acetyl-CoA decarbonylase/synthase complex subunit delta
MINNVGNEVWKAKEAKLTTEEAPTLGDAAKRGYIMEAVGAVSYLLAGSDILILRHPETVKLVNKLKDQLITGNLDMSPADLAGKLAALNVKPQGEYPEIVKTAIAAAEPVKEEKKAAPAKAEVAPKSAPAKPAPAPKAEPAAPKAAAPKVEEPAKISVEEEAKIKAEAEAKTKAEIEAKAKAEAEARVKAETEAKAKAEAEAKAKVEAEQKAKDEDKAKAKAEEEALQAARAAERAKKETGKPSVSIEGPKEMKVAEVQMSAVEKLLAQINRVNKR